VVATGDGVAVSVALTTRPGYATGHGAWLWAGSTRSWRKLPVRGDPLAWDGERLWLGNPGLEVLDLATREVTTYRAGSSRLPHDAVAAVVVNPTEAWVALRGDYVTETKDFRDGGVARLESASGRWTSFGASDGLARSYCCDVAADVREVWVAHWEEEIGLSVLDRASGRWRKVATSANGLDVGGVCLALDGDTLWVGQQGGLVRLDRRTLAATVLHETDGLPGYIVSAVEVGADAVWASVYAYGVGGVRDSGLVRIPR
jgi:ligand-binding sensor domain-containing protein